MDCGTGLARGADDARAEPRVRTAAAMSFPILPVTFIRRRIRPGAHGTLALARDVLTRWGCDRDPRGIWPDAL